MGPSRAERPQWTRRATLRARCVRRRLLCCACRGRHAKKCVSNLPLSLQVAAAHLAEHRAFKPRALQRRLRVSPAYAARLTLHARRGAAVAAQSSWRGARVRRKMREEREGAATRVQRLWRRHRQRRRERDWGGGDVLGAALALQALVRGRRVRRRVHKVRRQLAALAEEDSDDDDEFLGVDEDMFAARLTPTGPTLDMISQFS